MKLYICWGTFSTPRPGGHPCASAYNAVREAGYDPEVIKSYGLGPLPEFFNRTTGRQDVKRLTGKFTVPVLITDDGEVIQESEAIVAWARANPLAEPAAAAS